MAPSPMIHGILSVELFLVLYWACIYFAMCFQCLLFVRVFATMLHHTMSFCSFTCVLCVWLLHFAYVGCYSFLLLAPVLSTVFIFVLFLYALVCAGERVTTLAHVCQLAGTFCEYYTSH